MRPHGRGICVMQFGGACEEGPRLRSCASQHQSGESGYLFCTAVAPKVPRILFHDCSPPSPPAAKPFHRLRGSAGDKQFGKAATRWQLKRGWGGVSVECGIGSTRSSLSDVMITRLSPRPCRRRSGRTQRRIAVRPPIVRTARNGGGGPIGSRSCRHTADEGVRGFVGRRLLPLFRDGARRPCRWFLHS